nr:MAG TPA: hypothetical protein [Caudoviricetes sp.]
MSGGAFSQGLSTTTYLIKRRKTRHLRERRKIPLSLNIWVYGETPSTQIVKYSSVGNHRVTTKQESPGT